MPLRKGEPMSDKNALCFTRGFTIQPPCIQAVYVRKKMTRRCLLRERPLQIAKKGLRFHNALLSAKKDRRSPMRAESSHRRPSGVAVGATRLDEWGRTLRDAGGGGGGWRGHHPRGGGGGEPPFLPLQHGAGGAKNHCSLSGLARGSCEINVVRGVLQTIILGSVVGDPCGKN